METIRSIEKAAGALTLAAATLAMACQTEEIGTDRFLLGSMQTTENSAALAVAFVPDYDTYEQSQATIAARTVPTYRLRIDGHWAIWNDTRLELGGWTDIAWLPPGPHVFELVDGAGNSVLQTGPCEVSAGQANHLLAFGARTGFQYRFLSRAIDIPEGIQRYTVLNLVRGQTIDVVTCSDTISFPFYSPLDCTALSPALAYGEDFTGEAPRSALDSWVRFPIGTGPAGIYHRLSPTAAVPTPPLNSLTVDVAASAANYPASDSLPVTLAAPFLKGPGGFLQAFF